MLKVCTVNVGTLRGRRSEVVDMLGRRKVDICCVQEVRYRNGGTTSVGDQESRYKFWYSGNEYGTNGVGVFVKQELAENVIEVVRRSDRIMEIKVVLGKRIHHVISAYAPQAGRPLEERMEFFDSLEDVIMTIPLSEGLVVAGDLNGHIGQDHAGYEEVMGCFGFGNQNVEGKRILDMCKDHELKIVNTYFKKDREKLITYKSGGAETQLDLLLLRSSGRTWASDCTAIPGEACLTQHRMVRMNLIIADFARKKWKGAKKIKTWKLKMKSTEVDSKITFVKK